MRRFFTLAQYRLEVLQEPQAEVARRAKTVQGMISRHERGILPKPWRIADIARAYRLTPERFIKLVTNSKPSDTPLLDLLTPSGSIVPMPRAGQIARQA